MQQWRFYYRCLAVVISGCVGWAMLAIWYCPSLYRWLDAAPQLAWLFNSAAIASTLAAITLGNGIGWWVFTKIKNPVLVNKKRGHK